MFLESIGTVLACQVMAPLHFMNWPALLSKITVTDVVHREAKDVTEEKISRFSSAVRRYNPPKHLPKRTIIKYNVKYSKNQETNGSLVIDHEDGKLDYVCGSNILEKPYMGSAELGLAIIGLPGILLFSPLLILNALAWYIVERATGMDRYSLNVYLKVKDQLDPETKVQFKAALMAV